MWAPLKKMLVRRQAEYRMAAAYAFRGKLLIHAQQGNGGYYVAVEPCIALPEDETAVVLGESIVRVLDAFQKSDPPEGLKTRDIMKPVLKAAGAKSNRELQQEAKHLWISDEEGKVVFTPTHNGGTRGEQRGFTPLTDDAMSCRHDASAEMLAEHFRKALDACTDLRSKFCDFLRLS